MCAEDHEFYDSSFKVKGCGECPAVDFKLALVALTKQIQRVHAVSLEVDYHGADNLPGRVLAKNQSVHDAGPPFLALHELERELAEQAKLKDAKERGVKCDAIGRKTRKIGAEIDALESEIGGS